jgi:hypothetical protein
MTDPTPVSVAVACRCPGTPHDGDSVYLRPTISLIGALEAQELIYRADATFRKVSAAMVDGFLRHEIVAWTFTDEQGDELPVTEENIERLILSDFTYASPIADRASELYADTVIRPLVDAAAAAQKSLLRSQTNGSTSAKKGSSSKRRKQPKSSSMPTSPTDATATTSS